jgi:AraC family transcriptional regulator, ethanolamine operon transcriptional activator
VSSLSAVVPERTPPRRSATALVPAPTSFFPAGTVEDVRAASGEGLPAAFGWEVEHAQLETGRCASRRVALHTAAMQLGIESWSVGVLKSGRVPRRAVTFLVPLGRDGAARIQRRACRAGDVIALFEGAELDYRSAGAARLATVSLESAALDVHVRRLLGRRMGELRLQGCLNGLRTDPIAFRRLFDDVVSRAASRPRLLRDPAAAGGLERQVVKALLSEFEAGREPEVPSPSRALARKAEAFLRQNRAEPPTIRALCDAIDASERTLHEAFREHLGTTPKAYLKTLRLNAARHDLLTAVERKRVTDVALDWGFLHFGWFSQDYKRLFGETPSETLHRGRREAPRGTLAAGVSRWTPAVSRTQEISW